MQGHQGDRFHGHKTWGAGVFVVSVLAEHAIGEEKIDESAVEAALQSAQAKLKEAEHLDPQEFEHLQSMVRFAGVQLAVKRRRR